MANFIETLIGNPVKRQDEVRLTVTSRPPPIRPRQLLELFIAMSSGASFQGLRQSIQFKIADPQTMVFSVLGRWPTLEEVAAFQTPYQPWPQMQALLRSEEFRIRLPRIVCDAFAERRRLLFVAIPGSFTGRVTATLHSKHPVLPTDLADKRYDNPTLLVQTLGSVLGRMNISNSLALIQPTMAVFCDNPANAAPVTDPLSWHVNIPPCRTGDLLFAIIRDPVERALAYVNRACADLRSGTIPFPPALRSALSLPAHGSNLKAAQWREIARWLLANTLYQNPICAALGDGTAENTLAACRRVPIILVPPDQFGVWGRTSLDTIPPDAAAPPETILRTEDLTAAERAALERATGEDRVIHARVIARREATSLPSVPGREL